MGLLNVTYVGESTPSDNIEANILYWLNWNLLNTGAFFNISLNTSGSYGGNASRLRLSNDSAYDNGQVWESFRKQWVWQSGIDYGTQPIQISGVYVNNVFRPATGVGPYAFNVDYPNGRIIFNSAISTTSTVMAEYSCNYYQLYNSDCPWWREIQRNSFRVDDSSFLVSSSGFWARSPDMRIQLPAIIVEATPIMNKIPRQLGNLSVFHQQDFRLYIIAETNRDRKWIVDTITLQNEEQRQGFDSNLLWRSGVYPINLDGGSLNTTTMSYPDLVRNFPWNRPWSFKKFSGWMPEMSTMQNKTPLFPAILNATVETYL